MPNRQSSFLSLVSILLSMLSPRRVDTFIGSLCLFAGVGLALIVLAVRLEGLSGLPTGMIYRNPVMMWGFSVLMMFGGARLLWQHRSEETAWTPSQPGRRFEKAVFYTKPDCPLCDEAAATLSAYQSYLPPLDRVNVTDTHDSSIDADDDKTCRYRDCVPVLELDGRRRFTGHISEPLLRRLIEGTPPHEIR